MVFLGAEDRPSPLASQIEVQTRDLDWTLAHFAFVADVTTLASECDIAHSPAMSVASCRALPKQALAFIGESPELLATYAAFLADPGSEVDLVVNEAQHAIVEAAFEVQDVVPRWQMIFRGDPADLQPGQASKLADNDLGAALALAKAEQFPFTYVSDDPFEHGPAFGLWERRKLVAMGTTAVYLPGAAQIDNVVTRAAFRRQGCATQVVSALVTAHLIKGRSVFLLVDQDNDAAIQLFETLGFVRNRAIYVMHCLLADVRP